jgi:hypothetical protein
MEGGITALRGDRRETLKERNTDIEWKGDIVLQLYCVFSSGNVM